MVKSDFFRFMKDARISLGRKTFLKDQRDFFAYSKIDVIFLGRQILKLGFFLVQNMSLCRTPPPPVIKGPMGNKCCTTRTFVSPKENGQGQNVIVVEIEKSNNNTVKF